jgi:hypothetical protein
VVELRAPENVPWTEEWSISCSPIFSCTTQGPAPLRHVQEGVWSPLYRVWPGEAVALQISRPTAVQGQTVTVDSAELELTPGRRLAEATLLLQIRTSGTGQQVVTLPSTAALQGVTIDGLARPIQAREGNKVHLPLQPGQQTIEVRWQQPHDPTFVDRVPAVDVGSTAVNVTVTVKAPPERWIVTLSGPRWGPVPLFWIYVLLVALAAPLLARLPWAPLSTRQWLLLGLGMTQVHAVAPVLVVLWFVALGFRKARPIGHPVAFNTAQVGLLFLTLAAAIALYAAIHAGLLWQPDMQVQGNGSSDSTLRWYLDRLESTSTLPMPVFASLPLWVWRVLMLLWSLWLAASFIRWVPWAWGAFSEGGIFRPLQTRAVGSKRAGESAS